MRWPFQGLLGHGKHRSSAGALLRKKGSHRSTIPFGGARQLRRRGAPLRVRELLRARRALRRSLILWLFGPILALLRDQLFHEIAIRTHRLRRSFRRRVEHIGSNASRHDAWASSPTKKAKRTAFMGCIFLLGARAPPEL